MKKSSLKEVEIRLRPTSSLPDLTCNDGEVAQFRNVDWLQDLVESSSGGSSGSGGSAGSGNHSASNSSILTLASELRPELLPSGATLLAIHAPEALHGDRRMLILTPPDSLALFNPSNGEISYLAGAISQRAGNIRKAVPFGNYILLITDKGNYWIIYNQETSEYTFTDTFPDAPQVEFSLDPEVMTGYNLTPGDWPKLEVEVELPLSTGVSEAMLHNWLDGVADGRTVSEEIKAKVFKAVGKAVAEYEDVVAARGLYLTLPKCVASYDGMLPTYTQFPVMDAAYNYSQPCARLQSWGYNAEVLYLTLYFSLVPMRLSAKFAIPAEQRIWTRQFDALEVAVTSAPSWHDSGKSLTATAYTSYTDPATQTRNGFAFRFGTALYPEEVHARACNLTDFRVIERNRLLGATQGSFLLNNPAGVFYPVSPETFNPDYGDLTIPSASDAEAVDQGYILFGGEAVVRGIDGSRRAVSLNQSVLASHPDYPFIFRHLCHVGDGSVVAVRQAGGSRGSGENGRHPLHILSEDGIRLLSADSKGGFINSRLIAHTGVRRDFPVASGTADTYFMTTTGLCSLSLSSSLKEYEVSLPEGEWRNMEVLGNDEALLISSPGVTTLFDLQQMQDFPLPDISLHTLFRYQGEVIATDSRGRVMILRPDRIPINSSSEVRELSKEEEIFDSRDAYALTRPLKLGAPFARKCIRGIGVARPDISVILEASDNLTDWQELCRYMAPREQTDHQPGSLLRGLRLPSFRYYRLHLSAPETSAQHLAVILLTVGI